MSYQDYRMRLWVLDVVELELNLPTKDDPWGYGWWDTARGFVVRAESEEQARELANAQAGEENSKGYKPWLESKYTTCEELTYEGEPGIVIRDYINS